MKILFRWHFCHIHNTSLQQTPIPLSSELGIIKKYTVPDWYKDAKLGFYPLGCSRCLHLAVNGMRRNV